jgi:hypothetical protein
MIKEFKIGKYYHLKFPNKTTESLVIVVGLKSDGTYIEELASNTYLTTGVTPIGPVWRGRSVEVDKNCLPLYVGWKFVSPELANIIAGTKL